MIQVFFRKSPRGKPFYLAYAQGEHGFVTPQKAEALLEAGMIDPVDLQKSQAIPSEDFVTTDELEPAQKEADLSTEIGVKTKFGTDVNAMRKYCADNGIKVSKAVKRPETFWAKIAKHHS